MKKSDFISCDECGSILYKLQSGAQFCADCGAIVNSHRNKNYLGLILTTDKEVVVVGQMLYGDDNDLLQFQKKEAELERMAEVFNR